MVTDRFAKFAKKAARYAGHPITFLGALCLVVVWALTGPIFGFGDTWQLVINTGTTIITFLMVFLIQNSQNCDSAALQLKIDELVHATSGADDAVLDLEELDEESLEAKRQSYLRMAEQTRNELGKRRSRSTDAS